MLDWARLQNDEKAWYRFQIALGVIYLLGHLAAICIGIAAFILFPLAVGVIGGAAIWVICGVAWQIVWTK